MIKTYEMNANRKKAVVLTSGGLDSTTCIGIAIDDNREVYPLSIMYGQLHVKETDAIKNVIDDFKKNHVIQEPYGNTSMVKDVKVVSVDLRAIGGSALTDDSIDVPVGRDEAKMSKDIPPTYVPARNTIMLSIALGYAEVIGAEEIWIGANDVDYSGYPDCRPEYLAKYEELAALATVAGIKGKSIKIVAPLLNLTKAGIIKMGLAIGVPYRLTWSCYQGQEKACGECDSCVLRLKGFNEIQQQDPIDYQ